MAVPPSPTSPTPTEQTLNVKLTVSEPVPLHQRQLLPEKAAPAPGAWEQTTSWWNKQSPWIQVPIAALGTIAAMSIVVLGVALLFLLGIMLSFEGDLQTQLLAAKENAGLKYTVIGPKRVAPRETAVLQLTLVNASQGTPITLTRPLTNVTVYVLSEGQLPVVLDRASSLLAFGDFPPGVSETRNVTVTLNTFEWWSGEKTKLSFWVKTDSTALQLLGNADLSVHPIPGVTKLKGTIGGLLSGLLTAAVGLLGLWLRGKLGMTKP
jgi:hypothetical protein